MPEYIDLVNNFGEQVATIDRADYDYEIHQALKQIVVVPIIDSRKRIIIHTRPENGRWEDVLGHVQSGETPEAAARREVAEEIGLTDIELFRMSDSESLSKKHYLLRFLGVTKAGLSGVKIDKNEVGEIRAVSINDLIVEINNNPDDFYEGYAAFLQNVSDFIAEEKAILGRLLSI